MRVALVKVKLPSGSRGNNEARILCLARSARSRHPLVAGWAVPRIWRNPLPTARSNPSP